MGKVGTIGAGVLVSLTGASVLTGAVTAGGGAAAAGEGTAIFYWCNALPAGPDMIVRQSRIYRARLALDGFPDAGGARAAFQRDLERSGVTGIGILNCLGPFDTYREAVADRLRKAEMGRITGWTVISANGGVER
jgi:hypothetical protein